MLKFETQLLADFRNGIQHHATTKHGLWCSIVRHSFSYGGDAGKYELGIFVPNRTAIRTSYNKPRHTLPYDVTGWLELDEAKQIAERFADYPAHKLSQAYKYFRKARQTKSMQKARKLQRKAERLLRQLPPCPSIEVE
jgi:hypothetical protein